MTSLTKAKPFDISKQEVMHAWRRVRANRGAAGVDKESLEQFGQNLHKNLYKLWNRMSSGSYFPKPVRRVEIPKKDGSKRPLGIPTVTDRIAQEVVRARLSEKLEPIFHDDSYGYRPGKSAIDAVGVCRERNWKFCWALDVDIHRFFDTINHELLLKAVNKYAESKWEYLYIERWLKAEIKHADGREESPTMGTPQGGVISPLLANLYLHFAFDKWMARAYPLIKFERYADDIVIHCGTQAKAEKLKSDLVERLKECGLSLCPEKTKVVYCKNSRRKEDYPDVSYTFLGYTFQPRKSKDSKTGKHGVSFAPAASISAQKQLRDKLKAANLMRYRSEEIEVLAKVLNPILRGWFNYFSCYRKDKLSGVIYTINFRILKWVRNKYRLSLGKAIAWLKRVRYRQPKLFAHWS